MRWSYKTVHYELQKEGLLGNTFLDESEVEKSLNEYGKAGWELVSILETMEGLIAVFKQPLSYDSDIYSTRRQGMTVPRRPATETAVAKTASGTTVDAVVDDADFQKSGDDKSRQVQTAENIGQSDNEESSADVGAIRIE